MLPLLPQETIDEARLARATAKNPSGMSQLSELENIKSMTIRSSSTASKKSLTSCPMPSRSS